MNPFYIFGVMNSIVTTLPSEHRSSAFGLTDLPSNIKKEKKSSTRISFGFLLVVVDFARFF